MKNSFFILIFTNLTSIFQFPRNWQIDWQQCFGGTENDYATDIVEKESTYLIIGVSKSTDGDVSYNHGGDDGWLIQTDTQGTSNGKRHMEVLQEMDSLTYWKA